MKKINFSEIAKLYAQKCRIVGDNILYSIIIILLCSIVNSDGDWYGDTYSLYLFLGTHEVHNNNVIQTTITNM